MRESRRGSASVLVWAALGAVFALAAIGILAVSSAHGHGLASGDRLAVLAAAAAGVGCLVVAGRLHRSR